MMVYTNTQAAILAMIGFSFGAFYTLIIIALYNQMKRKRIWLDSLSDKEYRAYKEIFK